MSVHAGGRGPGHTSRFTGYPSLPALLPYTATLAAWDASERLGMRVGVGGVGPAPQPGNPVGWVKNRAGTGLNLDAGADARCPAYTNGLTFDASNDRLGFVATLPAAATVIFIVKGVTATAPFINDGSNTGATAQSGVGAVAGGSAGGTVLVDGVTKASRDDLFTAACNGSRHVIEQSGANFSTWANLYFNGYPGLQFGGILIPVAVLNEGAGDYATALTAARTLATTVYTRLGI